jgi:hypothetical protein
VTKGAETYKKSGRTDDADASCQYPSIILGLSDNLLVCKAPMFSTL